MLSMGAVQRLDHPAFCFALQHRLCACVCVNLRANMHPLFCGFLNACDDACNCIQLQCSAVVAQGGLKAISVHCGELLHMASLSALASCSQFGVQMAHDEGPPYVARFGKFVWLIDHEVLQKNRASLQDS